MDKVNLQQKGSTRVQEKMEMYTDLDKPEYAQLDLQKIKEWYFIEKKYHLPSDDEDDLEIDALLASLGSSEAAMKIEINAQTQDLRKNTELKQKALTMQTRAQMDPGHIKFSFGVNTVCAKIQRVRSLLFAEVGFHHAARPY
jgi:hypothetical protein